MIYDSEDIKKIIKKNYKEYVKFQYPLSFQILYIWQNSLAKDLDTSLILSYLSIQALKTYNRNNKKNSFKDLIKNKEINIGKVKKAEISRELKIPRETVRRKLEELNKKKLIFMYDGSIKVNQKSFEINEVENILNKFSKIINLTTETLARENIVKKKNINDVDLLNNFSHSWLYILSLIVTLSLIWKKLLKSMENWFVFGVCGLNQMYNLKDSKNFKDLHYDDTENFFLNITQIETRRGLNPTTISDLSGIPRQTVIRNLKTLVKLKVIEKENKTNLFFVPKNTSQHKSIIETLENVQLAMSSNIFKMLQVI